MLLGNPDGNVMYFKKNHPNYTIINPDASTFPGVSGYFFTGGGSTGFEMNFGYVEEKSYGADFTQRPVQIYVTTGTAGDVLKMDNYWNEQICSSQICSVCASHPYDCYSCLVAG